MPSISQDGMLPLLKWPGGKRSMIAHLRALAPTNFAHYFEPFVGGGALFFHLQPDAATLSDKNGELINCYSQVRDNPEQVIANLAELKNTPNDYYAIRESSPSSEAARAARMVYLSTLSFNGIYRENTQGKFNVPYGYKYHINPCQPERIYAASRALSTARLIVGDFEDAVSEAGINDFVFLDPPYTVAHQNNGFIKYNAKMFSWQDQTRLALVAAQLVQRGCYVLVSNANHPSVHELYPTFTACVIERSSVIAASKVYRRRISECIYYTTKE